jgi:hypothetical protein
MMVGARVQAASPAASAMTMIASHGKLFPFLGLSALMLKFIRDDIGTSRIETFVLQSGFFVDAMRRKADHDASVTASFRTNSPRFPARHRRR